MTTADRDEHGPEYRPYAEIRPEVTALSETYKKCVFVDLEGRVCTPASNSRVRCVVSKDTVVVLEKDGNEWLELYVGTRWDSIEALRAAFPAITFPNPVPYCKED